MNTSTFGDLPRFQTQLSRRLLAWSLASLLGGTLLVLLTSGFWEAFGIQALAWGGVDALIALAGLAGARKRPGKGGQPGPRADDGERRARRLRRVLWINTGLDLLYVTAGVGLIVFFGGRGPAWAGHGWGVVLQGAFLLFFDLIHAQSVPTPIEA
ncbi:MAG: hypothetical protein JW820_19360, partial [Spirochaetales bacterium]|nr:hypothetical protein [Spirochaetales bacterium]